MRSNLLKRIGVSAIALTGIGIAASIIVSRAQADEWDKMTLLTVDQPIQVGNNTYLEPGTYMFKLANSDRHIVQIFTKDRSHLINTIFAIPSYRVELTDGPQFTFWETPPGTAKAVRTWYYPGDHFGQEFLYPTNLRQIAALTTTAPASPAPAPAPQALEQAAPAEQPPTEVAQTAPQEQPQAEQAPVEIAQNTPPPDNAAPPPPSQPDQSQTLPQTASPYPLFGLGGLFALGLYAALRIKTVA